MLTKRPMTYQGNTHSWMRRLGPFQSRKWTDVPIMDEDTIQAKEALRCIGCPECGQRQSAKSHKSKPEVSFSQLTCQRCRKITPAAKWACQCLLLWYKCHIHVHERLLDRRNRPKPKQKCQLSKVSELGYDMPFPKTRNAAMGEPICSDAHDDQRISLKPGSKLGNRFPHFVTNHERITP